MNNEDNINYVGAVYELTDVEIVWAVKNDAIASVFLGKQKLFKDIQFKNQLIIRYS